MGPSWIARVCSHKDFLSSHPLKWCLWHFLFLHIQTNPSVLFTAFLALVCAALSIFWRLWIRWLLSSFRTPLARVTGSCSDSALHGDEPGKHVSSKSEGWVPHQNWMCVNTGCLSSHTCAAASFLDPVSVAGGTKLQRCWWVGPSNLCCVC